MKSISSSLKILGYLVKKRKFDDSTKHYMILRKVAYLGGKLGLS